MSHSIPQTGKFVSKAIGFAAIAAAVRLRRVITRLRRVIGRGSGGSGADTRVIGMSHWELPVATPLSACRLATRAATARCGVYRTDMHKDGDLRTFAFLRG